MTNEASLRLTHEHWQALRGFAARAFPRECCGLIVGRSGQGGWRVSQLVESPNLATGADRFEIDPALHARTQRAARAAGEAIIGVYHSHPDGSTAPSENDRARAANLPGWLWLIIGITENGPGDTAAWLCEAHGGAAFFRPVTLVIG